MIRIPMLASTTASRINRRLRRTMRAAMMAGAIAAMAPAIAAGPLVWLAGKPGAEGNLDGPAATATWGGPLMLHADGNGVLVMDHYGATLRRIDGQGVVTTLAGKSGQRGRVDGSGGAARFSWPSDAVRGPDGRIYVADTDNDAIRVVSADGQVSTLKVHAEQADDEPPLNRPVAIAFDAQGWLWVAPQFSGKLLIVTPEGRLQPWQPDTATPEIVDLATDGKGQLWGITATDVGRIHPDRFEVVASLAPPEWQPPIGYRVSPPRAGPVAERFGQVPFVGRAPLPPQPAPPAEFARPEFRSLCIDRDGTVYIADARRILKLPSKGSVLQTLFSLPRASRDEFGTIAARQGEVLVSAKNAGIYRLDASRAPHPYTGAWLPWDDLTGEAMPHVHSISVDDAALLQRDGSVLFLDKLNHAIGRVDARGVTTLWAGGADEEGNRDGPRLEARFHFPSDMVQDRAGNIYVSDGGNGSIRRIGTDGTVTTIAGSTSSPDRTDGSGPDSRFWRPKSLALDEARGILYVLDTSPYIGVAGSALRSLELATGEVKTIGPGPDGPPPIDEATFARLDAIGLLPQFRYEDIAVGANGSIFAIDDSSGMLVWRIDPAGGRHTLIFAEGPNAAKDAHYAALSKVESSKERERLENNLIRCDWAWCLPDRIEADANGFVYLSDGASNTVIRIDPDGNAGVIVGRVGMRGNRDGALPGALNDPGGLGWTRDGSLMINTGRQGIMLLREPHRAPFQQRIQAATPTE